MYNRLSKASRIYREEGLQSLVRRTRKFIRKQVYEAPGVNSIVLSLSIWQVRRRMHAESDLEDVLDTVLEVNPGYYDYFVEASQLRDELGQLVEITRVHQPKTVLEIGTNAGGTLYTWCRGLDSVETVISLDLPGGEFGGGYPPEKQRVYEAFTGGLDDHFVRADAHEESTYRHIRDDILGGPDGSKVDFLFIDADHTYEGVKQEFETYKRLVADDGIIALHDIVHHPDDREPVARRRTELNDIGERHLKWGDGFVDVNVHDFWSEVREEYRVKEIISHPQQSWGGIGVVFLGDREQEDAKTPERISV